MQTTTETTQPTTTKAIRLMKFYATDGVTKARCWYSKGSVFIVPGKPETAECVTIYATDYGHDLAKIFGRENYDNDTDYMTDYFDKGRVRIFPSNPLYAAALARAERRA